MTNKPPSLEVVASIHEMDPDAVMVCAPGAHPTGAFADSIQWISGKCSQCGGEIHFSVTAPPQPAKVCVACGFKDGDTSSMAITESTMDELLEIMGLPDTPEMRAMLKDRFLAGVTAEIERRHDDH